MLRNLKTICLLALLAAGVARDGWAATGLYPPNLPLDCAAPASSVFPVWESGIVLPKKISLTCLFAGTSVATTAPLTGGGALPFGGALTLGVNSCSTSQLGVIQLGGDLGGTAASQTIQPGAVSYSKIQNVTATSRLLGRASTGAGVIEELTLGAGFSLPGGALTFALPTPTSSTLGGIESIAAASHFWIDAISNAGVPHTSRPACADVSDAAASCATDATNASNLSAGTLPAGRLPTPTSSTLGGAKSLAATSHMVFNGFGTDGIFTTTQLSCLDLSGAASTCSAAPAVYGAAGGGHSSGLMMDTGATAHTPPKVAGDDAAWHSSCPALDRYSPDRQPDPSVLSTAPSDEFRSAVTISLVSFNSGEGLSAVWERGSLKISQTSGTLSHINRGYVVSPPAGDWLLCVRLENEQATKSGTGPGLAGLIFGVGGTRDSPSSAEMIRYGGSSAIDHANNTAGNGFTPASNVRASGALPGSSYTAAPQFITAALRYTSSSRLTESFYSVTGYSFIALGSTTPASALTSMGFFLDSFSTTILPAIRVLWMRTITDATRITNLDCGGS